MRGRGIASAVALACFLGASPWGGADAAQTECASGRVTVSAQSEELAQRICDVSDAAAEQFATCNLEFPAEPISIFVLDELPLNCFGVFHCGKNRIELLTPRVMAGKRAEDSIFTDLPPLVFFDSVVVHELAHAAFETMKCPEGNCTAAAEYVAFAMQFMSLPPELRSTVADPERARREVSRDELMPFIYFLKPDLFATRVWAHFQQQPDACGFIGQIVRGEVELDNVAMP